MARATLHAGNEERFFHCPPITVARVARQGIAFSGTLGIEGEDDENPDDVDWVFEVDHWYSPAKADVMVIVGSNISLSYFSMTAAGPTGPHDYDDVPEPGDRLLVAGRPTARSSRIENGVEIVGHADACLTRRWSPELAERFRRAFATTSRRARGR